MCILKYIIFAENMENVKANFKICAADVSFLAETKLTINHSSP